jgi:hypothetical protein
MDSPPAIINNVPLQGQGLELVKVQSKRTYQRWYDQRPPVKESLSLIKIFPGSYQAPIAQGMGVLAEKRYKAHQKTKQYSSLGRDHVIALYKANEKRRAIDKQEDLFRLYRYMMILPPDKGDDLAHKMTRLMRLIGRYLRTTRDFNTTPEHSIIKGMVNIFVEKGEKPALGVLLEIEHSSQPVADLQELQTYQALATMFDEDKLVSSQVMPSWQGKKPT